jgi:hypothetical protein
MALPSQHLTKRCCRTVSPRLRCSKTAAKRDVMQTKQTRGSYIMNDIYKTPESELSNSENNSGSKGSIIPDGIKGWSWGAFLLNWIWAIFNKSYIGLLALIPYVGFLIAIYLGIKGRELAWKNKKWESLEHFNRVQRKWSIWGSCLVMIPIIGILAAIAIPAYQDYLTRTGG